MKHFLFFSGLLIFSLFRTPVFAASYYLYYDPGCMARLQYVYPETREGSEFIMYTVMMNNTEKLIMEIGIEAQSPIQPSVPAAMIDCNTPDRSIISPALVDAINNRVHQVYVVSPVGNGQYRVALVKQAHIFKSDGLVIKTGSGQYRFNFFRDGRSLTGDLSDNDSRGRVFFMEMAAYGGCTAYIFRQTYNTPSNYLDIYVVPEFGIVEERSSTVNSSFRLKMVNNVEAANYLNKVCEIGLNRIMEQTMTAKGPTGYDQPSTSPAGTPRMHVVEKGETQFSISRRYQLYVSDLQKWNNIDNNTVLYPGMKLFIEPVAAATSYDLTPKAPAVPSPQSGVLPAWLTTPPVYIVGSGETAGSIAQKLGYTEERFRYFNNLSPTAILRPGDEVKTSDCEEFSDQGQLQSYETAPQVVSPYYQDRYWSDEQGNVMTPRSAVPASTPQATPSTAAPAQRYYGPVPGVFNANQPLYESQQDPNAYLRNPALTAPAPYDYTPKSPAAPQSYNVDMVPKSPDPYETLTVRRVHIVRENETLGSIARRYGVTEESLRKLNNLAPGETVLVYQRLFVN